MSENISDFTLYKKKKVYTKENFYTPVFNAFIRTTELNIQEKCFYIYIYKDLEISAFKIKLQYVKSCRFQNQL